MVLPALIIAAGIAVWLAVRARIGLRGVSGPLYAGGFAAAIGGWIGWQTTFPEPGYEPDSPVPYQMFVWLMALGGVLIVTAIAVHTWRDRAVVTNRTHEMTSGEWFALAFWALGGLAIGWLVIFSWIWTSQHWTARQKLLGSIAIPGGPVIAGWLAINVADSSLPGALRFVLTSVIGVAAVTPALQALYLGRAVSRPATPHAQAA